MIKKITRIVFRSLFRLAVICRWYGLFVLVYSRVLRGRIADGRTVPISRLPKDGSITILALSPDHFHPGNLDALAANNKCRLLQIPECWQTRLIYLFYSQRLRSQCQRKTDFTNPPPDSPVYQSKTEFRSFLRKFLLRLYRRLGIDCVISPHNEYHEDIDWGEVSKEIGVPYIVLHRESFLAISYVENNITNRLKNLYCFRGSHMVVYNELSRKYYIDIGYVSPERISSLGCPRMDNFLKKLCGIGIPVNKRKKVVLFPFSVSYDGFFSETFRDVHVAIARLAKDHPEIDILIKPKKNFYPSWRKQLDRVFKKGGIKLQEISNLHISTDLNVQQLLLETDVVCGFNTTAILEAAIAGKPVIIPYFQELQNPKYDERIKFREALYLFDLAGNAEELESLILYRLEDPKIERKIMEGRKALFEKYVSSIKGDATEKHITLIKDIVNKEHRPTIRSTTTLG